MFRTLLESLIICINEELTKNHVIKKKSQCFSMNMITFLNKIFIMTIYQKKKKTIQEVKPIVTNALFKNFNKLM